MSIHMSDAWGADEIEKAKTMWFAGHSASEIAAVLARRSRNAVIGIVARQGWKRTADVIPMTTSKARIPNWTPAEREDVKAKWLAGRNAAEIVADYPARTEQAVLALVYRSGLKATGTQRPKVTPAKAAKTQQRDKPAKTVEDMKEEDKRRASCASFGAKAIEAFVEPANDNSVLLLQRRRFQCAWPVGDAEGAEMMCCGGPVDETATASTQSYCTRHRGIASAGIKEVKAPREANVVARRGPSRSVWDGGRVA